MRLSIKEGIAVSPSPGRVFRAELAAHVPLLLPGVQDALSARLARRAGFAAAYLSGSATAMALLGLPDIGLLTGSEIIDQARRITAASDLALVVDADTGFGNAVNVAHTVKQLEAAGAAGVQLEDQTFPKRCGHFDGKDVIPAPEMRQKLYAATEARRDDDFVIVARTDARAVRGLDEAIERGISYHEAGADIIFVEAPQSEAELRQIAQRISAPTLVNVIEGGRTPQLPLASYGELGFSVVLHPTVAVRTVARALEDLYGHLRANGTSAGSPAPMVSFAERNSITGFNEYEDLAARAANRREQTDE